MTTGKGCVILRPVGVAIVGDVPLRMTSGEAQWAVEDVGDGKEILRCGLKCTTPRLRYASLVASERKLRMTTGRECVILSAAKDLRQYAAEPV